jgi:phage tail sheath protein FI
MASSYRSPGVYSEDVFLKPQAKLETGVPGFVGFANVASGGQPAVEPNTPVTLHRKEEFNVKFTTLAESFLAEAVAGFFDNGGSRCYVTRAAPIAGGDNEKSEALKAALDSLSAIEDLDLVAAPDAMTLSDEQAIVQLQREMLKHCAENGDRLVILDSLSEDSLIKLAPDKTPERGALEQRELLALGLAEPASGALYYPWLRTLTGRFVPPCGHVAGVYARSDAKVGPFKAPANEELFGVTDLESRIDNHIQGKLNPRGINCLRVFAGRGIRVWGARTLSLDTNWRYVSVRRLLITIRRWIDLNMTWAAFEPNEPRLWVRVQRELNGYLESLWRAGALIGQTPQRAFYVKCDAETNPPEGRDQGQVVTEIGFAPGTPAEFIVIRITHRPGTTEVS